MPSLVEALLSHPEDLLRRDCEYYIIHAVSTVAQPRDAIDDWKDKPASTKPKESNGLTGLIFYVIYIF